MGTLFVSRHPGALAWARKRGVEATVVTHLDVQQVRDGDVVIGTLPVHLAAEVCARGARYVHLSIEVPVELRGRELSEAEMEDLGAQLVEFEVVRRGNWPAAASA
ncbi:MAG: hypothetical protein KatS3mg126_1896 [Lysobacteraceae bacterium]|nr:MAG: hypothetical protein KatS3mg126_1896 [Xanthomonadaceae bacterium]